MHFLHWVGGLWDSGVNSLHRLWDKVHDALTVLWHTLASLGHVVGGAWDRFRDAVDHLGSLVADLADAAYTQTRRLLTITIPTGLRWARDQAISEAKRLTHDLRVWTTGALRAATSWAGRIVADLRSWTGRAVKWLTGLVDAVRRDLAALRHTLRYVIAGPDSAAAWLFGALVRVLLHWLKANAEALARYFAGHIVRLLLRNVATVEQIITDIF